MFPFSLQDMCLFQCDIWSSVKEGQDQWGRRELLTPPPTLTPEGCSTPQPYLMQTQKHRQGDKQNLSFLGG